MTTPRFNAIRRIINRSAWSLQEKRQQRSIFKQLTDAVDIALGMASSTTQQNQLLSGTVTWISGLTFQISECTFVLDNEVYTSAPKQVTLSAADGSNSRIDVFYASADGAGVLEGTAAADPAKPQINYATQVEISFALIEASATTPANVTNTTIYDEDDDWTTAVSDTTVAKAATADPYGGTKHVQFTDSGNGAYISFTNSAAVSTGGYDQLAMWVRPSSIGNKRRSGFLLEFFLGNDIVGTLALKDGTYGLDAGTDAYQMVSIPISDLGFPQFDVMRIKANTGGVTAAFDNIILQVGTTTASPSYAYTNVVNAWSKAQVSPIIPLTDGATISVDLSAGNVFEVTLGGNRTIDFVNAIPGEHFTMIIKQDATGSRTLTWDSANDWAGGTAPTLSTGANAVDVLTFMVDSSGNIHGTLGIADSQ